MINKELLLITWHRSRAFDFATAIWDCRFSESMETLLSPVHIASNEPFLEIIEAVVKRTSANRNALICWVDWSLVLS